MAGIAEFRRKRTETLRVDLHSPLRASECLARLEARFEQSGPLLKELAAVLHKPASSAAAAGTVQMSASFDGYRTEIFARSRDGSTTATFKGVVREDDMGGCRLVGDIPILPPIWFQRAVYGLLAVMSVAVGVAALNGENTIAGCVLAAVVVAILFRGFWQSFPKERAESQAVAEELVAKLKQVIE